MGFSETLSRFGDKLFGRGSFDDVDPIKRVKAYKSELEAKGNEITKQVLHDVDKQLKLGTGPIVILNTLRSRNVARTSPEAWLNTVLILKKHPETKNFPDLISSVIEALHVVKEKIKAAPESRQKKFLIAIARDAETYRDDLHSLRHPEEVTAPAVFENDNAPASKPEIKEAA